MAKNKHFTEVELLENYRVALTNVVNQTEIAEAFDEIGYDSEVIAQGQQLLDKAVEIFNFNKQEDNETIASRAVFDNKRTEVKKMYSLDRKKTKVVFRNDPVILKQLGLTGSVPQAYSAWVARMKVLYKTGSDLTGQLQASLARLKITPEVFQYGLNEIEELESARANYLKEIGESQDATKAKDAALEAIDEWMMDFYAVAKIAMEDKPQLLESLGMLVRS